MPEPTRQYIFSEHVIRNMFIGSVVLMTVVLLGILLLASARPQGRYRALDDTEFRATVETSAAQLEGYEVRDDGTARIDIRRAMELVVERGVADPFPDLQAAAQPSPEESPGTTTETETALPDGAVVFNNCAGCHQANGEGLPGVFPPLAGHAPELYNADRTYLIDVLLYGLQGEITVNGQTYNGLMPAWQQLSDAEIAAVLNHILTAWGNDALVEQFEPFAADEVAAQRGQGLSMSDVHALREQLELP